MPEKVPVHIPKNLYEEIKRRVKASEGEFKSVEDYVEFVLTEVIKEEEEAKQIYTPTEEEEIKRRLKSLGYL